MPHAKQIFPLPFVGPPRKSDSGSNNARARWHRRELQTDVINSAITALNGLARGDVDYVNDSSKSVGASSCVDFSNETVENRQASQILQRQARVVGEISRAAYRWVNRRLSGDQRAETSSKHGDIVSSSSSVGQIDSPSVAHGVHADQSLGLASFDYTQANPAVDVIADKISLPSDIGSVDLLDILPPDVAARYSRPNYGVLQLPPIGGFKQQPRAFLCTNAEYVKLVRRMLAVDMIELSTSAVCVNGLFAVAKPDGSLRLIIDERNGNQRWHAAPKVTLTTPDMIASLSAEPNVEIESAGSDIADFYHRCRIPAWMRPYHALPALKAGDISSEVAARFGHQTMVFPLCKTLPMGFSHAVFLAQSAHEFIIDSCTEMKRADRILPCNDLLLDRPRHSVYIDDFWLAGPKGCGVPRLFKQYLSVMEGKRLPAKLPKVTSPTTGSIKVLGMEFNGTTLQFGLGLDKLHRLVESTQALLEAGECSGCQLSQLLGKWMGNAASSAAAQRVSECLSICAEGRLAKISNLGLGGEGTANNLCISSSDVLQSRCGLVPLHCGYRRIKSRSRHRSCACSNGNKLFIGVNCWKLSCGVTRGACSVDRKHWLLVGSIWLDSNRFEPVEMERRAVRTMGTHQCS